MEALDRDLSKRVERLIETHKPQQLLSTTGMHAAIDILAARIEGLEKAIREIALEVERSKSDDF